MPKKYHEDIPCPDCGREYGWKVAQKRRSNAGPNTQMAKFACWHCGLTVSEMWFMEQKRDQQERDDCPPGMTPVETELHTDHI